jgi:hypothetical protein
MTDAPAGILALWLDMAPGTESELNEWFNREHHAERVDIPGFVSARRYVALRGTSEYFIFYRTQDLAVLTSPAYLARLNEPTPWTSATMPHFRNTSRSACPPLSNGRGSSRPSSGAAIPARATSTPRNVACAAARTRSPTGS